MATSDQIDLSSSKTNEIFGEKHKLRSIIYYYYYNYYPSSILNSFFCLIQQKFFLLKKRGDKKDMFITEKLDNLKLSKYPSQS